MLSLKQLSIFSAIIEKGSFTTAAESLFMTQPAISWQMKKLEEDLGVSLFQRRDRSLALTEAGEIVYRGAREMLGVYHNVLNGLESYKEMSRGRLAIGAGSIPGEYILPQLLSGFREQLPKLQLRLEIGDSASIIEMLAAAKLDIAVVGLKKPLPELEYIPWLSDEIIAVAAPKTQIPEKPTLDELLGCTLVGRGAKSGTRAAIERALALEGLTLESFANYISISSNQSLLNSVAAGLGIAFISRWAALPLLERGQLLELKIKQLQIRRSFYLARWRTTYPAPASSAFADYLQAARGDMQKKLQKAEE